MELLKLFAQTVKIDPTTVNIKPTSANLVVTNILYLVYFLAGVVAVIVIILAGFTFVTSVYDQAKITQAKNTILYAVVGLVVIIMAFTITQWITGRF